MLSLNTQSPLLLQLTSSFLLAINFCGIVASIFCGNFDLLFVLHFGILFVLDLGLLFCVVVGSSIFRLFQYCSGFYWCGSGLPIRTSLSGVSHGLYSFALYLGWVFGLLLI